jgi:hypothetical protein
MCVLCIIIIERQGSVLFTTSSITSDSQTFALSHTSAPLDAALRESKATITLTRVPSPLP